MTLIDMFVYESSSYRRQLKALYRELDQTNLPKEISIEERRSFFRRMLGRFLAIARLKNPCVLDDIPPAVKIPTVSWAEIEAGTLNLTAWQFAHLADLLHCSDEVPIFREKMEKAMTPGLREARKRAEFHMRVHGFRFADSEDRDPC